MIVRTLLFMFLAAPAVLGQEAPAAGRFQVVAINGGAIRIDTATGKSWNFVDGYRWVEIAEPETRSDATSAAPAETSAAADVEDAAVADEASATSDATVDAAADPRKLYQAGRFEEAVSALAERGRNDSLDAPAFRLIARCLWAAGRREDAAGVLDRALERFPDEPETLWLRGMYRHDMEHPRWADDMARFRDLAL